MTLFEYIAIAFSMMLSITVLRALSVVPHAIQAGRRYWVYLIWLFTTLLGVLFLFWTFWWYRDLEWNIVSFLIVLASPAVLYVYVSILAPENAANITSWRDYFYAVRVRFFLTGLTWVIVTFAAGIVIPVMGIEIIFGLALILMNTIGALSSNPQVHAVLVFIPPILFPISTWLLYFQPA